MKNVAVVGLDKFNRRYLDGVLNDADDIVFHSAIDREDTIIHGAEFDFEERLDVARRNIDGIDGGVDGIFTYWDFPSNSLATLLADKLGVHYASPAAVLRCEHKLWGRQLQSEVIDTPAFTGFSPFDDDPLSCVTLDYPFWVKPVVGHSSMLGFEINDENDFDAAPQEIREDIRDLTRPFRHLCAAGGLPRQLAEQGTAMCIAEEIISHGDQYTLEGWVRNGDMNFHGVIESYRTGNEHTFSRYQYPSTLDPAVVARMEDMSRRVLERFAFDQCPFNIEYFYDPESDRIRLLEVNARISQSHSDMFLKVDGQPNQQVSLDLALGREPRWRKRQGEFNVAAKFFLRHDKNARVARIPTRDDLEALRRKLPDVRVDMNVEPGMELTDLEEQESYSFDLADVFIGGRDEQDLLEKFAVCREILDFELKPVRHN